jgi:hypothetical protein
MSDQHYCYDCCIEVIAFKFAFANLAHHSFTDEVLLEVFTISWLSTDQTRCNFVGVVEVVVRLEACYLDSKLEIANCFGYWELQHVLLLLAREVHLLPSPYSMSLHHLTIAVINNRGLVWEKSITWLVFNFNRGLGAIFVLILVHSIFEWLTNILTPYSYTP